MQLVYQEVKTANGEEVRNYASTNITAADPNEAHLVKGVEKFAVESFSENANFRYLDQAELEILPVPSGELIGMIDGEVYRAVPTEFSYEVENAYPGSEIYLEIVEVNDDGVELLDTRTTVLDTHRNIPIEEGIDYEKEVTNLGDYVTDTNKTYRTRLISKSIYGIEILSESTNVINNDILVRAGIHSL